MSRLVRPPPRPVSDTSSSPRSSRPTCRTRSDSSAPTPRPSGGSATSRSAIPSSVPTFSPAAARPPEDDRAGGRLLNPTGNARVCVVEVRDIAAVAAMLTVMGHLGETYKSLDLRRTRTTAWPGRSRGGSAATSGSSTRRPERMCRAEAMTLTGPSSRTARGPRLRGDSLSRGVTPAPRGRLCLSNARSGVDRELGWWIGRGTCPSRYWNSKTLRRNVRSMQPRWVLVTR
jgi:hypothetical protein